MEGRKYTEVNGIRVGDIVEVYGLMNPLGDYQGLDEVRWLGEVGNKAMVWLEGKSGAWDPRALRRIGEKTTEKKVKRDVVRRYLMPLACSIRIADLALRTERDFKVLGNERDRLKVDLDKYQSLVEEAGYKDTMADICDPIAGKAQELIRQINERLDNS